MQDVGISSVKKLHRSVEIAQRTGGVAHRGAGLSPSLPAVRFRWIGLPQLKHHVSLPGKTLQKLCVPVDLKPQLANVITDGQSWGDRRNQRVTDLRRLLQVVGAS